MSPRSSFGFVSIRIALASLVLAIQATAATGNVEKQILHRNIRQTSGKLCPALKSKNTIVTCVLRGEEVACDSNVQPGTTANVKCKRYYKPSLKPDYTQLTCLDSGEWDKTLFSCTPVCGSSHLDGGLSLDRILGGTDAGLGTFPWHAGIYYRRPKVNATWEQQCSGSLITDQFVITVAHCMADTTEDDLRVALGKYYRAWDKTERSEAKRSVSKIIYPQEYNKRYYMSDVALLRLDEKVEFGEYIMPVCRGFPSGSTFLVNKDLYVPGWGLTRDGDFSSQSNTLQYNTVVMVAPDICRENVSRIFPTFDKFCTVKDNQTKKSVLQRGDSGVGITAVHDGLHFILGAASTIIDQYSIFTNFTWPYNAVWIENEMRNYYSSFRWEEN